MASETTSLIADGGIVFLAVFIMVLGGIALHRGWIVMGGEHSRALEEKVELAAKLDALIEKYDDTTDQQRVANQQQIDQLLRTIESNRETIAMLVAERTGNA